MGKTNQKFFYLGFFNLLYIMFAVLVGAFVRATGSGAGCGNHWPLCNGQAIPREPVWQTVVEYSHRLSSGLTLPICLVVFLYARKLFPKGHRVISCTKATLFLLVTEALIGAFLVKFEHVAANASTYRAVSMSAHLINTFLLIASASALCYFALPDAWFKKMTHQASRTARMSTSFVLFFYLVLCLTGAITALGDTLFPVTTVQEAWTRSLSASEHLLVRLRIYHPFIAMTVGTCVLVLVRTWARRHTILNPISKVVVMLILGQLCLGYLNVNLLAPIPLQLAHLFLSQALWISLVVFSLVLFRTKADPSKTA